MAVNATGVFFGLKHAIPAMIANGGGSIVNLRRLPASSAANMAISCSRPLAIGRSILPLRAQASRRCETQAPLSSKPPSYASVSVPGPLPRAPGTRSQATGRRTAFRSEQRTGNKPKGTLDTKSPIQVRIQSPPAESQAKLVSLGGSWVFMRSPIEPPIELLHRNGSAQFRCNK